jgi:hypothetical protein
VTAVNIRNPVESPIVEEIAKMNSTLCRIQNLLKLPPRDAKLSRHSRLKNIWQPKFAQSQRVFHEVVESYPLAAIETSCKRTTTRTTNWKYHFRVRLREKSRDGNKKVRSESDTIRHGRYPNVMRKN